MLRPTAVLAPLLAAYGLVTAVLGAEALVAWRERTRLRRAIGTLEARLLNDLGLPADFGEPRLARPF
jgi:uncharacterized protein YjiS (DUF1127 family)